MLKNHTAMITGSSGGIGSRTLEIFSKNNANIIACSRRQEKILRIFVENWRKNIKIKFIIITLIF